MSNRDLKIKLMKTFHKLLFLLLMVLQFGVLEIVAQNLTNADYNKALWMTTRMYGGQRSGHGPNWLIVNHTPSSADMTTLAQHKGADVNQLQPGKCFTKDADGAHSLEGGWVDCGDHVKFGQTMFYSAYVLLKAYAEFPEGFNDFYSFDYIGYRNSGDYSWEGGRGEPNGIPDILDEIKYQTDFLIKCARNNTTFYSQVGSGPDDHKNWVTSVAMATLNRNEGGQREGSRVIVKNPNDCAMPSMAAATLALMARVYEQFDPAYAALCLTHAGYAYQYAKAHLGNVAAASPFYPANANWQATFVCATSELYWATGNTAYRTEALSYAGNLVNHNWCFNYNNVDDVAAYNLAKLGHAASRTLLESFVNTYKGQVNANGLFTGGDGSWGPLRYNANAAFIVALWGALNNSTTVDPFIYAQVNYILGVNSANHSFVVGFVRSGCGNCKASVKPHHRNVFLRNDIMGNKETFTIPTKNQQHGYMLGGTRNPGSISDQVENYYQNEGGIDYNAGLVGALGYIMSRIAPVNPNQFGRPRPDLGPEKTLCGTGSVTLTATVDLTKLKPGENVTYRWFKGNATTPFAQGATVTSVTVNQADTYHCDLVETSGAWTSRGSVVVSATLPDVNLGSAVHLCTETSKLLDAEVTGTGISYVWRRNNVVIDGATARTYTAYTAGTYRVTVNATGCTSKSGEVVITSSLLPVKNDTICSSGTVNLQVLTPGTYQWFNTAEGGTAVATGQTYSPSITATRTYYVQDANSVSGSVGPTTRIAAGTNWGVSAENHLNFTVNSSFNITSLKMNFGEIYNTNAAATITIEILDGNGNAFSPARTFTSNPRNVTTAMANSLIEFEFANLSINQAWGPNLRMRLSATNVNGAPLFNESGASYPYNSTPSGVVSITGKTGGGTATAYMYFYDWKISAGSTCARTPVLAVIDPNANCGDTQAPTVPGNATFSNITQSSFTASWTASTDNVGVTGYDVYLNGTLYQTVAGTSISITGLSCNTQYAVRVRARDAAGNVSALNTERTTTTLGIAAPSITSNSPVCVGGTIELSIPNTTGATYAWTGPNGFTAATRTVSRANTTTAMAGVYTATITVGGCTSIASTTTVVVNAVPAAPTITSNSPVCVGGTIELSVPNTTGATYAWTGPNGFTAATRTVSRANATTAMAGVYTATITVGGCTSTASTTTVVVNAVPAAPTITSNSPVCVGGTIELSVPNTTGATYAWTGPNGFTAATRMVSRANATTAMAGGYTATITVGGCTSIASTTTVTVNTIPAPPAVMSPVTYSVGETATSLTATGTNLLWYTVPVGGTGTPIAPTPSTLTVGTTPYYPSQTVNGCESEKAIIEVIVESTEITQTISLETGWNLISFFTLPDNPTVENVFGASLSHIHIIKDSDGFFMPTQNAAFQSLQTIELGKAYLVRMNTPQNLSVTGNPIAPVSVSLQAGWNMLGYPKNTVSPLTTELSDIWSQTQTIKNFDAFRDQTSGTLQNLTPGEGYYLYLLSPGTLQY